MSLYVIPREGVSVARFGEGRDLLRERIGLFESFQRAPGEPLTDHFLGQGLLLGYGESDELDFIEIVPPAEVMFDGLLLLGRNFRDVVSELGLRDVRGFVDDSGIEFSELCFALYTPAPGDSDSLVEAVTLFAPGYYD